MAVPRTLSEKNETFEKRRREIWVQCKGFHSHDCTRKHTNLHMRLCPEVTMYGSFEHLPGQWHSIQRIFSSPQDESSHLTCLSFPSVPHQSCCLQVGAVDRTNIDFANFLKPVCTWNTRCKLSLWNPFLGLELNYMQIKKRRFNYTWCSSCLHIQNEKKCLLSSAGTSRGILAEYARTLPLSDARSGH